MPLIYPPLPEAEKISTIDIIVGKRRYGKTWFTKNKLIPLRNRYNRLLVIDPKSEYGDLPGAVVFSDVSKALAYLKKYQPSIFTVVVQTANVLGGVDQIFAAAKLLKKVLVVCDEIALYVDKMAEWQKPMPWFIRLILDGGHEAVDMIVITQKGNLLPLALIDNANEAYCFHQPAESVTKAFGEHVTKDRAARIGNLPKYQYETIEL